MSKVFRFFLLALMLACSISLAGLAVLTADLSHTAALTLAILALGGIVAASGSAGYEVAAIRNR